MKRDLEPVELSAEMSEELEPEQFMVATSEECVLEAGIYFEPGNDTEATLHTFRFGPRHAMTDPDIIVLDGRPEAQTAHTEGHLQYGKKFNKDDEAGIDAALAHLEEAADILCGSMAEEARNKALLE